MKNEVKDEVRARTKDCIRCNVKNSANSKFCTKCGLPLDNVNVVQMDRVRAKVDELLNKLTEDPKKLATMTSHRR